MAVKALFQPMEEEADGCKCQESQGAHEADGPQRFGDYAGSIELQGVAETQGSKGKAPPVGQKVAVTGCCISG